MQTMYVIDVLYWFHRQTSIVMHGDYITLFGYADNLTCQVDQLCEEVHRALLINEGFDFGSCGRNCLLTESEMCAAD